MATFDRIVLIVMTFLMIISLSAAPSNAGEVALRSGSTVKGRVVKSPTCVTVVTDSGQVFQYQSGDVLSVKADEVNTGSNESKNESGKGEDTSGAASEKEKGVADKGGSKMENPVIVMKTSMGDVELELFEDLTPNTVGNFISLAEKGFYDNLIFHRVIKDFMIQGGCPSGTGTGGPGYKFADEIDADALGLGKMACKDSPFFSFLRGQDGCPQSFWDKSVKQWYEKKGYSYGAGRSGHKMVKGVIAMANSGPNTNGSQFYIVTTDECPWLDGKHTVFGKVIKGMDVVDSIEKVECRNSRPVTPIKILKIEIRGKGEHEYEVNKL
jgi:peptidyl-prolyl cis-trans isomerase A (cyclophilin A)